MADEQIAKQKLPYPYNQDLSSVLCLDGLNRQTSLGRQRVANDPVTASYLAAGMRLIEINFGPRREITPGNRTETTPSERPLFAFLSQRAVANEVANNPDPFHRMGSTATLRSTWKSQSDFIADLLRFGLWSQHYSAYVDADVVTDVDQLIEGPNVVEPAHSLAYRDLATLIDKPTFRLHLAACATGEGDEAIRQATAENYQGPLERWKKVYADFMEAHELQLRPGITLDDFANLLAAALEGLALRALADATAQLVDHDTRRSLLGTVALAFILSCMERRDEAQELTLEEAVQLMVQGSLPNQTDEQGLDDSTG
jgi:hypothetical protein